jgi:hypothetical protein
MPSKRLPKNFWSDCLLEAVTGVDISKLATYHGRLVQVNAHRRPNHAASSSKVISDHQPALTNTLESVVNHIGHYRDTRSCSKRQEVHRSSSAPTIIILGPSLEPVGSTNQGTISLSKAEIANETSSANPKPEKSFAKNAAGKSASQSRVSATNVVADKTCTQPANMMDNSFVNCSICNARMREDEVSGHIDQNHTLNSSQTQFQDLPITTPIDQLPVHIMGRRNTDSRLHSIPVVPIPVYGYPAPPWNWSHRIPPHPGQASSNTVWRLVVHDLFRKM